jgi:hypothetical protein
MKMCEQQDYYKRRLKGLARLLIKYWIIIVVFSIISIIIGSSAFMPGNLVTLLGNVFLFDISYNGAWWYMWAYALIVLISPVILKFVKKAHPVVVLVIGFVVYCAAYYVRFDVDCQYGYSYARISPTGCNSFTINGGIGSSNSEILGPASKGAVAKIEVVGGSGSTAIYVSKNNGPFALRRQGGSSLSYTIDF